MRDLWFTRGTIIVLRSNLSSHLWEELLMGTTLVTMLVRSADSLVFSLTSDSVRPTELLAFISSIVVYHSSVAGSKNSRVVAFEKR